MISRNVNSGSIFHKLKVWNLLLIFNDTFRLVYHCIQIMSLKLLFKSFFLHKLHNFPTVSTIYLRLFFNITLNEQRCKHALILFIHDKIVLPLSRSPNFRPCIYDFSNSHSKKQTIWKTKKINPKCHRQTKIKARTNAFHPFVRYSWKPHEHAIPLSFIISKTQHQQDFF